jgi:hypothetical protein
MRQKKTIFPQPNSNLFKQSQSSMENYLKNSGNPQSYDIMTKINCGNKLLYNPKDIANALNKFYIQIVTNSNIKRSDTDKATTLLKNINLDNIVQMEIIPVSEAEVITIIMSLNQKTQQDTKEYPIKT